LCCKGEFWRVIVVGAVSEEGQIVASTADGLARRLAEARPSVGAWDDLDFDGLSAEGRINAAVACERLVRHAQGLLTRALGTLARAAEKERGVEQGCTEAEAAAALNLSAAGTRLRMETAGALTDRFPETVQALSRGEVGWGQAVALVEATAAIEDRAAARAVQQRVLTVMPGQNVAATRKALRRAVLATDPDGAERRHEHQAVRRRVELRTEEDGMVTLALYTAAETGVAMMAALTRHAERRAAGDERSIDQRRADALAALVLTSEGVVRLARTQKADMASGAAGAGAGTDPVAPAALVHLVVGIDTLLGGDEEPGDLRGYGPVTARQARALAFAEGSVWRRLLTAPDGTLVHADPRTYRPTAAVARHVRLRDQHCTFPGCAMPASRCDLDHVQPYRHGAPVSGGATTPENLHALCRRHHRLKTVGLWDVTRDSAADTTMWSARTGHSYVTRPEPYYVAA